MKKILFSMGSIALVVVPVVATVSCGTKTIKLDFRGKHEDRGKKAAKFREELTNEITKKGWKKTNLEITGVDGIKKTFTLVYGEGDKNTQVMSKIDLLIFDNTMAK